MTAKDVLVQAAHSKRKCEKEESLSDNVPVCFSWTESVSKPCVTRMNHESLSGSVEISGRKLFSENIRSTAENSST